MMQWALLLLGILIFITSVAVVVVDASKLEQVLQSQANSGLVHSFFQYPQYLTESVYFDRFHLHHRISGDNNYYEPEQRTYGINFSVAFDFGGYYDYAQVCRYLMDNHANPHGSNALIGSASYNVEYSDILSGCYADLVFTTRNMIMRHIQETTYSAIFAAASAIPAEQVHAHAGVLLATTYPMLKSRHTQVSTMNPPRPKNMCMFGKFSVKLTFFMLSRAEWQVILYADLDLGSQFFLDLMTLIEMTARVNKRKITIMVGGAPVFQYDPITQEAINNRTQLDEQPGLYICEGLFVWGNDKLLGKALKYAATNKTIEDPVEVIYVQEHDPKSRKTNKPRSTKQLYTGEARMNKHTDKISWSGSLSWPTVTAIQTRRNVFGHVQQEYELSVVRNSTHADTWFGFVRTNKSSRARPKGKLSPATASEAASNDKSKPDKSKADKGDDVLLTFSTSSLMSSHTKRRTCHRGQHEHLILITYTNEIFFQNALGLQQAIQSLHIADVISTGDFPFNLLYASDNEQMHNNTFGHSQGLTYPLLDTPFISDCKVLQITIGPHEPNFLLETYVVYDAEQVWSVFMEVPAYISLLKESAAVFVMSTRHASKYERIEGFNVSNVYAVPFFTALPGSNKHTNSTSLAMQYLDHSVIEPGNQYNRSCDNSDPLVDSFVQQKYDDSSNSSSIVPVLNISGFQLRPVSIQPMEEQYINRNPDKSSKFVDILFFGSCSDHRREFLAILDNYHDRHTTRGKRKPLNMNLKCIKDWKQALIGHRRDIVVRNAKVVVNIHVFEQSSLEVHRLNYLLAMGKCVVSERSTLDPQLDATYADNGVIFGDGFEDIVERVFVLLNDEGKRLQCESNSKEMYDQTMNDTQELERGLRNTLSLI
jgi:hypothetical protein